MKSLFRISTLSGLMLALIVPAYVMGRDLNEKEKAKLAGINEIITAAVLDGDFKTQERFYSDETVLAPCFRPPVRGLDEIVKVHRQSEREGSKIHSLIFDYDKRWIVEDQIYESGSFSITASSRPDSQPRTFAGSYFQIWKIEEDGDYKILYHIWNVNTRI